MATNNQAYTANTRTVVVRNSHTTACPAFGLMEVVGQDEDGTLVVTRPRSNGVPVLINGSPTAINGVRPEAPGGDRGQGQSATMLTIGYDGIDGIPQPGEKWGAGAKSWLARKNQNGYAILGVGRSGTVTGLMNGGTLQSLTRKYYPYPYGSYPDDPGGSVSWLSTINIGCRGGGIMADEVRYTETLISGNLSISMALVRSYEIVPTACIDVLDDVTVTLGSVGVTCVSGVITVTQPTLTVTKVRKNIKVVACGVCV